MELSLDVSEVQLLVNLHRWVLLAPSPLATSCGWGVWLCLSPDHEIVRHDLGAIPHIGS